MATTSDGGDQKGLADEATNMDIDASKLSIQEIRNWIKERILKHMQVKDDTTQYNSEIGMIALRDVRYIFLLFLKCGGYGGVFDDSSACK